jgi:lysozyme
MTQPVCQDAIDPVKHFEGLYLKACPCPAGVPTIGYGHTSGVSLGQTITDAQGEQFLATDLTNAAAGADRLVTVALNPLQRGALASFAINLGAGYLQEFTLLKLLNQSDYEGAAGQFGRWVYATVNGVKTEISGLVKRRAAESALLQRQADFLTAGAAATAQGRLTPPLVRCDRSGLRQRCVPGSGRAAAGGSARTARRRRTLFRDAEPCRR